MGNPFIDRNELLEIFKLGSVYLSQREIEEFENSRVWLAMRAKILQRLLASTEVFRNPGAIETNLRYAMAQMEILEFISYLPDYLKVDTHINAQKAYTPGDKLNIAEKERGLKKILNGGKWLWKLVK